MTERRTDNDPPDREDRLMALLALTSQELPAHKRDTPNVDDLDLDRLSPDELAAVHDYLDAHPEAFERFLARQRAAQASPVAQVSPARSRGLLDWLFGGSAPQRNRN